MLRLSGTFVLVAGLVVFTARPASASDRGDLERLIASVSESLRVEDPGADPARRLEALLGTLRTLGVVVPAALDGRSDLSDVELAAALAAALDGPGAGERRLQLATLAEVFGGVAARVARSESAGTPAGRDPVGIAMVARTVLDQPAANPWKPVPRTGEARAPAGPIPRGPAPAAPVREPSNPRPELIEPAREVARPELARVAKAAPAFVPPEPVEPVGPVGIPPASAGLERDRSSARIEALLAHRRAARGPGRDPASRKADLTLAALAPNVASAPYPAPASAQASSPAPEAVVSGGKDPPFPRVIVPPAREVTIVTAGAPRLVGAGTHRVPWTSTVEVPNHTLVSLEVPDRGTFEIWDDSAAVVNIGGIEMLYGMIRRVGP